MDTDPPEVRSRSPSRTTASLIQFMDGAGQQAIPVSRGVRHAGRASNGRLDVLPVHRPGVHALPEARHGPTPVHADDLIRFSVNPNGFGSFTVHPAVSRGQPPTYGDLMLTPSLPLVDWSEEKTRDFLRTAMDEGWLRWSPPCTGDLLVHVLRARQPRPEAEILAEMGRRPDQPPGDEQAAWEEPLLRRDIHGTFLYDLYRADMDSFLRHRARVDELAGALGLPPAVRTAADTADYLVAAGLLCRVTKDGTVLLVPAWPVPLPEERLALTAEERRVEDVLRWNELNDETGEQIIALFAPDSDRWPERTTSLRLLAQELQVDSEDVRQALVVFMTSVLLSVNADIPRLGDDSAFVLTMNWETYDRTR